MINCILLVLLLPVSVLVSMLVSMVLLKGTFSSSDSFPKLRPIVSSFIGTFNYNLARSLCDLLSPLVLNDYSCKDTFSFVSHIKNKNLFRISTMQLVFLLIFHFKKSLIQQQISFSIIILILTSLKNNSKNFSFLVHHRLILFLTVNFIIKLIEQL